MNKTKRKAKAENKAKQLRVQKHDKQTSRGFAKRKQGKVDEAVSKYMQGR